MTKISKQEWISTMIVTEKWNCMESETGWVFPLPAVRVEAGFPSPADDYVEKSLDLNDLVVKRPEATFFVRVKGESMTDADIHSGDVLVVDRSVEPRDGHIVIAVLDGEFTVKQLLRRGDHVVLQPANRTFRPIVIDPNREFQIWGVVTYVIHAF